MKKLKKQKVKRSKNGFNIIINNAKFGLYFDVFNIKDNKEHSVVCTLIKNKDSVFEKEEKYIGTAKCNFVIGDVFSLEEGRRIAYTRAKNKFIHTSMKKLEKEHEKEMDFIVDSECALDYKVAKLFNVNIID